MAPFSHRFLPGRRHSSRVCRAALGLAGAVALAGALGLAGSADAQVQVQAQALEKAAAPAPAGRPASPPPAPFRLRVVGGLAAANQFVRLEEPFWTRDLARLSEGRYTADIVPFDRAGIPDVEMLRLIELGVVPFGTVLMSAIATQYPQYAAVDLAGLNPDLASLRASLAAFRPYLEKTLRERHGVEALAIYIYPAQVLFCKKPLTGLADLAGRRIRVVSNSQADFVGALGAAAVRIGFSQTEAAMRGGSIDCAVTGAASGNALGLHRVSSHLYAMPLTWGLAIFGANRAAWDSLPAQLRTLLRRELPRLETRIWSESERETTAGLACNSGASACPAAQRGAMVLVPVSASDERRRNDIFCSTVLPRWLLRCDGGCTELWDRTIGSARGIALPATP